LQVNLGQMPDAALRDLFGRKSALEKSMALAPNPP
jgi:hypothetical protein